MGRPRITPDELANCPRTVRLTPSDRAQLHKLALATRQTGAQVIRQLIRSTRWQGEDPVRGSCLPPGEKARSGE